MIEFKPYECPACGGDLEEEDVIDTWAEDEIYVELCVLVSVLIAVESFNGKITTTTDLKVSAKSKKIKKGD